jgi:hypothetical protein
MPDRLPEIPRDPGQPTVGQVGQTIDLRDGVILRRTTLKLAMSGLESALARPCGPDRGQWLEQVSAEVANLGEEVRLHIDVHEGPDSFHAEMVENQPHLAARVKRLEREHVRAQHILADILVSVSAAQEGSVLSPDAAEIRMLGGDLLLLLVHHRQRGADLVWESVNLDLGSGD